MTFWTICGILIFIDIKDSAENDRIWTAVGIREVLMKRFLLAAGTAVFLLAAQMTAYAGSGAARPETAAACITKDEACSIAKSYITEGSKFQYAESRDGGYEVVYYNGDLQEYYQIAVDSQSGTISSYKSWLFQHKGSKQVVFNEDQAKQVVLDQYPEACELAVRLDYKGDLKSYLVDFTADGMRGTCEINPESGTIIGTKLQME